MNVVNDILLAEVLTDRHCAAIYEPLLLLGPR
jgi:hypothetical protein